MDYQLRVISRTENGACCVSPANPDAPFWLSIASCQWGGEIESGREVRVGVRDWLARKHRQLVGDVEFEKAKQLRHERKPAMAEQRELSGILSKNDKQKDTQPDYRGSCLIDRTSYKISSWIKTRADGSKFMSLAFTKADEQTATQAKPTAAAAYAPKQMTDDGIPF